MTMGDLWQRHNKKMAKFVMAMFCLLAVTFINGMPLGDDASPVVPLGNQKNTELKKTAPEAASDSEATKPAEEKKSGLEALTKSEEKKDPHPLMTDEPKSDLPPKQNEIKMDLEQPQKAEDVKPQEQLKVAPSETVSVQAIEPAAIAPVSVEEVPVSAGSSVTQQKDIVDSVAEVQPIVKSNVPAPEAVVEPAQAKKIDEVVDIEKPVESAHSKKIDEVGDIEKPVENAHAKKIEEVGDIEKNPVDASAKAAEDPKLMSEAEVITQSAPLEEKNEEAKVTAGAMEADSKATETSTKGLEAASSTAAIEKDIKPSSMAKSNIDAPASVNPESSVQSNVDAVRAVDDVDVQQVSETQISAKSSEAKVEPVVAVQQTQEIAKEQRSEDKVGVGAVKVAHSPQENAGAIVPAVEQAHVLPAVAAKTADPADQQIKNEESPKPANIEGAQPEQLTNPASTEMKMDEDKKAESPMLQDSPQDQQQKSGEKNEKESNSDESSSEEKKDTKKIASEERNDSSSEEDKSVEKDEQKPMKNIPSEDLSTKATAS